jgi:hypothetical protein
MATGKEKCGGGGGTAASGLPGAAQRCQSQLAAPLPRGRPVGGSTACCGYSEKCLCSDTCRPCITALLRQSANRLHSCCLFQKVHPSHKLFNKMLRPLVSG